MDVLLQFCVEYENVYTVTLNESYLLLQMEQSIESLKEARICSTFDPTYGFQQVETD